MRRDDDDWSPFPLEEIEEWLVKEFKRELKDRRSEIFNVLFELKIDYPDNVAWKTVKKSMEISMEQDED